MWGGEEGDGVMQRVPTEREGKADCGLLKQ